ncbi:MAG: serine/threonine protein kinase [Deltaproteobacteria bacterium]|nr:serine/threonine protein kinase [Deltaproteobacteria bacterium]
MSSAPDDLLLPDERLPRVYGGYVLRKLLARGGMGEVYLANGDHLVDTPWVILKKLRKELTRDPEYVGRFSDEARVAVHLAHPHICRVLDVGKVATEYFLAMEYVSGCDVRQIQDKCRERQQPLGVEVTLQLLGDLLEALDYAHMQTDQQGEPLDLVHRDVSPQNVMIAYDGTVKLIDFGLAKSSLKVERTQPNVVMGKMAYMSPEQARGDVIDHRADLFAAGVIAYELLANERYYEGMGMSDIWQVVGRGGFVPRRWRRLPSNLTKILSRALHPELDKRFPTCAAFRRALLGELSPDAGKSEIKRAIGPLFRQEIAVERSLLEGFEQEELAPLREEAEYTRSKTTTLAAVMQTVVQKVDFQTEVADLPTRQSQAQDDATLVEDPPIRTDSLRLPDRSVQGGEERTIVDETEFVRLQTARLPVKEKQPIALPLLLVAAMLVGMLLMAILILVASLFLI